MNKEKLLTSVLMLGIICPMFLLVISCNTPKKTLKNYDTTDYTLNDGFVYYGDTVVAYMSDIELALDNNKIVYEVTFKLVENQDSKHAMSIIKVVHEQKPNWDIEIQYNNYNINKIKEL